MSLTLVQDKLINSLGIRYERDVPLGPLTWYGLGGGAALLAHPSDIEQLSALAARCYESGTPIRVLGSGANLLVADEGVDGVVVQLDDPSFKQVQTQGKRVTVGAGFDLAKLVLQTAKAGMAGLEGLAGIPASVGGAVRMNAGGIYGQIGKSIRSVTVCDQFGQVQTLDRSELVFGYRTTNISAPYIVQVEFEWTPDDPGQLVKQVKDIFAQKKNAQPLGASSAGCVFKNPPASSAFAPDSPTAGQLIDRSGLKGFRIGGAEVSTRHANFVVAYRHCTASDILAVLEHIQKTVLGRFGVQLEREVVCWP